MCCSRTDETRRGRYCSRADRVQPARARAASAENRRSSYAHSEAIEFIAGDDFIGKDGLIGRGAAVSVVAIGAIAIGRVTADASDLSGSRVDAISVDEMAAKFSAAGAPSRGSFPEE